MPDKSGFERIRDPDGAAVDVFALSRDESSLRALLEDLFAHHWHEIVFGPIIEGAAWELTADAPPSNISYFDGYLTVAFQRLHFHLCIGVTRGSRRNPTPAELATRRQTARAELFRRLDPSGAPVSWGLHLFNGALEQQMTVFLPNPLLSPEGRPQPPDWSRLAFWDALPHAFFMDNGSTKRRLPMPAFHRETLRLDRAGFERLTPTLQMIWIGLLAGAGTVASAAFACAAPFAAVAALAAATLPLRKALAVSLALWLGNQLVGFGLLGYPTDGETIAWGIIIGAASLAATFVAHRASAMAPGRRERQSPGRRGRQSIVIRLSILFVAAFATYQAGMLLGSAIVAAHGGLAPDIIAYVAFVNLAWAIGLGAGYAGLQMLAGAPVVNGARRRA